MSLPWFRLYRELKDDPKIGCLTDAEFRCYIESLCWACERGDSGKTGLTLENANWAFRRNVQDAVTSLLQKRLFCVTDTGEIQIPSWNKRQPSSDSSNERVRKYREKHKEPLQDRYSNGLEEKRVEEKRREKTDLQLRVEKFFNKRETTPWDKSELSAWKSAEKIVAETPESDLLLLGEFYSAPQLETYSRKTLATLLNNWNGEMEKARSWKSKKQPIQPKKLTYQP